MLLTKLLFFSGSFKTCLSVELCSNEVQLQCRGQQVTGRGRLGENIQPGKIQDKPGSFAQHQRGLWRDVSDQLTYQLEAPEGLGESARSDLKQIVPLDERYFSEYSILYRILELGFLCKKASS